MEGKSKKKEKLKAEQEASRVTCKGGKEVTAEPKEVHKAESFQALQVI